MEVEGQCSPSLSRGGKRLSLNKTVRASFGAHYVFDIASSWDNTVMAVSLSTKAIKIYSPMAGKFLGDCNGHTGTISDLLFPDPKIPHSFCSSSLDGTIRVWDTRNNQQVNVLTTHNSSEGIYSLSFGGSSCNLIAAGGKAKVFCWDWRTRKELACMEECHTEDVTQVRFHPIKREKLVSASVDGLMCIFNTQGEINDDEGLEAVMGVGTSVGKIGFCGSSNERLWCLTHIETLSIWDFKEGMRLADFTDARSKASANWRLPAVDYLVDCYYSTATERLWLIAGTNAGSVGYFPVSCNAELNASPNSGLLGPVSAVLEGGHTDVVRTIWSPLCQEGDPAMLQGLFCWTGGEDGNLCSWSKGNDVPDKRKSWVSSRLEMKKSIRQKQRHQPY